MFQCAKENDAYKMFNTIKDDKLIIQLAQYFNTNLKDLRINITNHFLKKIFQRSNDSYLR